MKVMFVFGGMPHYLDALMRKIADRGVEIVVVMPQKKGATIGKGVKTVEAKDYKVVFAEERKTFYGKKKICGLENIIKQEKPNIFVVGWPYMLDLAFNSSVRKALKNNQVKLVVREIPFQTPPYSSIKQYFDKYPMYDEDMRLLSRGRLFFLKQWILSKVRKRIYKFADATLNYSTSAYEILPSYGVNANNIYVTFNSSNTDELFKYKSELEQEEFANEGDYKEVIHIGRLVCWKRVDLLLEAIAKLRYKHTNCKLTIVGEGPELERLQEQAKSLGLEKVANFVGGVYDAKDLGRYMCRADVYVLAGMGGLSINDAMTYELPVICSVCDSTERDLVKHGMNGLFFENGSAHDLADKIDRLLSDDELRKQMGKESGRIIREEININTVADRYVCAFNDILNKNKA